MSTSIATKGLVCKREPSQVGIFEPGPCTVKGRVGRCESPLKIASCEFISPEGGCAEIGTDVVDVCLALTYTIPPCRVVISSDDDTPSVDVSEVPLFPKLPGPYRLDAEGKITLTITASDGFFCDEKKICLQFARLENLDFCRSGEGGYSAVRHAKLDIDPGVSGSFTLDLPPGAIVDIVEYEVISAYPDGATAQICGASDPIDLASCIQEEGNYHLPDLGADDSGQLTVKISDPAIGGSSCLRALYHVPPDLCLDDSELISGVVYHRKLNVPAGQTGPFTFALPPGAKIDRVESRIETAYPAGIDITMQIGSCIVFGPNEIDPQTAGSQIDSPDLGKNVDGAAAVIVSGPDAGSGEICIRIHLHIED